MCCIEDICKTIRGPTSALVLMCVIVSTQFTHSLEVYIKSTVLHLLHMLVSLFCVAYERVSFQVVTGGTQVEI